MKKILLITMAICVFAGCNLSRNSLGSVKSTPATSTDSSCNYITSVQNTTRDRLDSIIENNSVVFVDLYREGCWNCEQLDNAFNSLIRNKKICNGVIAKSLDGSNKAYADAEKFGLIHNGGYTTPLCLLYKDGVCVDAYSGYKSEADLLQFLKNYMVCGDNCVATI